MKNIVITYQQLSLFIINWNIYGDCLLNIIEILFKCMFFI